MKKRTLILCLFCVVMAVFCLAGCSKSVDEQKEQIQFDKDTVTVNLDENATTGFTWSYTAEPEDMLKLESDDFIPADTDDNTVGAGGIHTYVFKAQKPGEVTLTFEYSQAWENVEAEKTLTYTLKIDDQLNVTMK